MSSNLYFYKVRRINNELPSLINTDQDETYYHIPVDKAEEWEKTIGQIRQTEHITINLFEACSDIIGQKVTSISSTPSYYLRDDDDVPCMECLTNSNDGKKHFVTRGQLKKYYYLKKDNEYFYEKVPLPWIDGYCCVDTKPFEHRLLKKEDILLLAEKYYEENPDADSDINYYTAPVFLIMQIYFSMRNEDEYVVCERA